VRPMPITPCYCRLLIALPEGRWSRGYSPRLRAMRIDGRSRGAWPVLLRCCHSVSAQRRAFMPHRAISEAMTGFHAFTATSIRPSSTSSGRDRGTSGIMLGSRSGCYSESRACQQISRRSAWGRGCWRRSAPPAALPRRHDAAAAVRGHAIDLPVSSVPLLNGGVIPGRLTRVCFVVGRGFARWGLRTAARHRPRFAAAAFLLDCVCLARLAGRNFALVRSVVAAGTCRRTALTDSEVPD